MSWHDDWPEEFHGGHGPAKFSDAGVACGPLMTAAQIAAAEAVTRATTVLPPDTADNPDYGL